MGFVKADFSRNERTRLGLLTTSTIFFKKENNQFRTNVWGSAVEGRTTD